VYSSVRAHCLASALPLSVRFIKVSMKQAAQSTWCCTGRTARRLHVPQTGHADSVTCSIATALTGDLAEKLAQPQSRPDKVRPSHDGVSNKHNTVVWSDKNPHACGNELCTTFRCVDDQLFGTFVFESRPTGGAYPWFLQDELPGLLEDVPLIDEIVRTASTTEMFICHVKASSRRSFPWAMVRCGNAHHRPSKSAALAHWIIAYGNG
jgi:hypothetical protein